CFRRVPATTQACAIATITRIASRGGPLEPTFPTRGRAIAYETCEAKKRKHYPSFPLSRCEAMGEGGRRPGEGSFFDREKHFKNISFVDKEPSPALRAPSPILADGRGGKLEYSYAIALPLWGGVRGGGRS